MIITEAAEAYLATLDPDVAAWVRAQVEGAPDLTPEHARRLAVLLGLRPADHGHGTNVPGNGVATPKNGARTPKNGVATPFSAEFADRPGVTFTDTGQQALAALLRRHGADAPEHVDGAV